MKQTRRAHYLPRFCLEQFTGAVDGKQKPQLVFYKNGIQEEGTRTAGGSCWSPYHTRRERPDGTFVFDVEDVMFKSCEDAASLVFAGLGSGVPVSDIAAKARLAQFFALQAYRHPDKFREIENIAHSFYGEDLNNLRKIKYPNVRKQVEHADKWNVMFLLFSWLGSHLGNMRWTWVKFSEPLLFGGEDPFLYSVATGSFINAFLEPEQIWGVEEAYFPVSSQLGLFLSWGRGYDNIVTGDKGIAGAFNRIVIENNDDYFHPPNVVNKITKEDRQQLDRLRTPENKGRRKRSLMEMSNDIQSGKTGIDKKALAIRTTIIDWDRVMRNHNLKP